MSIALGFAVLTLLSLLVILLLVQRIERVNELLRSALSDLDIANIRESDTNRAVGRVFILLSPLLEQTDWMTGRWGGRFGELVHLENARNRAAVDIRSKLFALPFMKEYVSENTAAIRMGSLQSGLTGIENEYK